MDASTSNSYSSRLRRNPVKTQRYITMQEAVEKARSSRTKQIVILPPDSGDLDIPSDEEVEPTGEDDIQEVAGEVELELQSSDSSGDEDDDAESEPQQQHFQAGRWRKSNSFVEPLPDAELPKVVDKFPELDGMTPYEIWKEFFDKDMIDLLLEQTLLYAQRDKGALHFQATVDDMKVFLGIILLSGYHTLPSERNYWSNQPDLKVPFVCDAISRDRFLQLKSFIHLADNQALEVGNKVAKVQPLYNLLKRNLVKYGIFHKNISIDESMVPYHGKHSSKMFIRMKPIRFGFKLWVMAGSDGFPYDMNIYTGKCEKTQQPLGFRVVHGLLQTVARVSNPASHQIYFDNFFTSYDLLRNLHLQGFKATGTIRKNRSSGAHQHLMSEKDMKKSPRGTYDYTSDGYVCVVKWNDSAQVSLASNFQNHLPEQSAQRRVGRKIEKVKQPMLVKEYNSGMGGVDVMDKLLGSYRPMIHGKKSRNGGGHYL